MEIGSALEISPLGAAMRHSAYLYPAANVAHILALLIFFAAVAMMDARLLGAFRHVPWRAFTAVCRPLALAAFAVQALTGLLLLAPDAVAIVANPAFLLKLVTIALGLVNVVLLEALIRASAWRDDDAAAAPPAVRASAAISLAAWLSTAALGRLIAYV